MMTLMFCSEAVTVETAETDVVLRCHRRRIHCERATRIALGVPRMPLQMSHPGLAERHELVGDLAVTPALWRLSSHCCASALISLRALVAAESGGHQGRQDGS